MELEFHMSQNVCCTKLSNSMSPFLFQTIVKRPSHGPFTPLCGAKKYFQFLQKSTLIITVYLQTVLQVQIKKRPWIPCILQLHKLGAKDLLQIIDV